MLSDIDCAGLTDDTVIALRCNSASHVISTERFVHPKSANMRSFHIRQHPLGQAECRSATAEATDRRVSESGHVSQRPMMLPMLLLMMIIIIMILTLVLLLFLAVADKADGIGAMACLS